MMTDVEWPSGRRETDRTEEKTFKWCADDMQIPGKIDLGIAYPVDDRIGFTLTVVGKSQRFEMTRSAAASFAGRIAEALAK